MTHKHWWVERAIAAVDGWIYDCDCGAIKEVYIERRGKRVVTRERERESTRA